MRLNFGKLFQKNSMHHAVQKFIHIPLDRNLWPLAWKEIQYKTYDRFNKVLLPPPVPRTFGHADLIQRKSTRDFGVYSQATRQKVCAKMSLQQISNILFYSCGEVKKSIHPNQSTRVQPSAGARYPIEAYVLNFEPGDLGVTCYHYGVKDHVLEELWNIPLTSRKDISKYFGYPWSMDASMAIVLSAIPQRSTMKYGERGWRYLYLEAGAILNNIQNNAMLEGLGSVIMGGTKENAIEELLDLDGVEETVIMGILLG